MRRLLVAMLVALAAATFTVSFVRADNAERAVALGAAARLGPAFELPPDPALSDPATVLPALMSAARQAQVNVVRASAGVSAKDQARVTSWVLLTAPTRLFTAFGLREGRWLTADETASAASFLSTRATGQRTQVGRLRDIGGNDNVEIRPLGAAFASLPVAGRYVVEPTSQDADPSRFLDLLAADLRDETGVDVTPQTLQSMQPTAVGMESTDPRLLVAVQVLLVAVTALLLVYRMLHEAKRASVMRLHGFGALRIWYHLCGRLVLGVFALAAPVCLVAALLVPDRTARFVGSVLSGLATATVVMLAASLVTLVYLGRVKASHAVKNRKDTGGVFAANTLLKTLSTVLLLVLASGLWVQYDGAAAALSELGNWERSTGYGVF